MDRPGLGIGGTDTGHADYASTRVTSLESFTLSHDRCRDLGLDEQPMMGVLISRDMLVPLIGWRAWQAWRARHVSFGSKTC